MKKILLSLIIACLTASLSAQTWTSAYATNGELFVVKLDSAPFPHPDRAQGHTYQKTLFTADKNYSDNSVGIFVPKGFRATTNIDFVVHFHGWRHHVETTFREYHLAEQFVASGRNAILIVPQGPYDAPDSFGGKLEDTNGFKRFMGEVMATLRQRGIIKNSELDSIILSGHSGGYQVIGSIVARGGLSAHVKEVWLFDALYARREQYMDWFTHFPDRRFIDIYTAHGGTKSETETLMNWAKTQQPPVPFLTKNEPDITSDDLRQNHFLVIFSDLEHDQVVSHRNEFRDYLRTSRLTPIAQ